MEKPKRYYCGNGEGMFEDNKNGHWVEYSEHKAIVKALTQQLRKHVVIKSACKKGKCKHWNTLFDRCKFVNAECCKAVL
jgi:hypothetical protein